MQGLAEEKGVRVIKPEAVATKLESKEV